MEPTQESSADVLAPLKIRPGTLSAATRQLPTVHLHAKITHNNKC